MFFVSFLVGVSHLESKVQWGSQGSSGFFSLSCTAWVWLPCSLPMPCSKCSRRHGWGSGSSIGIVGPVEVAALGAEDMGHDVGALQQV